MTKKILVVDDQQYMHRLLQHHLARAGYDIVTAWNGREAVEKAGSENPQLILMDVMMPELDGLGALKQLKQAESTAKIPVILMTANSRLLTQEESASSGAAAFVTKPFSPAQLLAEIKRLLGETAPG